ncbi:MAG: tol-pal system protein YbgF [Gammaproteobacteria bacterium]
MLISYFKRTVLVAMLSCIALPVFADDAPVFDVDNYPPQFDGQPDGGGAPTVTPQPALRVSETPAVAASQSQARQYAPTQLLSTEQRIARLEQQINNLQHTDSASKMTSLQTEVQSLRGQVEGLTHQLQQAQSQQRSMYTDLDKRLNKLQVTPPPAATQQAAEDDAPIPAAKPVLLAKSKTLAKTKSKPASIPAAEPPATADKVDAASTVTDDVPAAVATASPKAATTSQQSNMGQAELEIYQTAYDLIKAKKYDQAIGALQGMLQKYPSGQFAANAHYWLGELYGLQGKNDQAAVEFANIVKSYPDSPKVSDAHVKLGMIYAAQFKWSEAKNTFKKVISRYPGSTSARLASQQLKEIKLAGH